MKVRLSRAQQHKPDLQVSLETHKDEPVLITLMALGLTYIHNYSSYHPQKTTNTPLPNNKKKKKLCSVCVACTYTIRLSNKSAENTVICVLFFLHL